MGFLIIIFGSIKTRALLLKITDFYTDAQPSGAQERGKQPIDSPAEPNIIH